MAINQNHQFEDLNGVKCAIVEKNCNAERVIFLKALLEHNGYTVIVVPAAPPKAQPPPPAPSAAPAVAEQPAPAAPEVAAIPDTPPPPPPPALFTVGVTDVMFNATNAIFGRLLKTEKGKLVTLAYWQQKDEEPRTEVPYFSES